MRVEQLPDDGFPGPAHAGWRPPEEQRPPAYNPPEAEDRAEPPGPVETPGHYDTGPAETSETPAEEPTAATDEPAAVTDEEQPDVPTQRVDAAGTTYGEPLAEDEDEPAVGVAPVPAEEPVEEPADKPAAEADDTEAKDTEVEEPAAEAEELAPGEVPAAAAVTFWEGEVVDGYRDRWQQIQLRFIDDPRQAAEQAHALVGDVVDGFAEAVQRQRDELNRWQSADLDDTEELRVSVRRYRDFLDRLLGL